MKVDASEIRQWLYATLAQLNTPKQFLFQPQDSAPEQFLEWTTDTNHQLKLSYARYAGVYYLARGIWKLTLNDQLYLEIYNPQDGFPNIKQPKVIFYHDHPDREVNQLTLELLREFSKRFPVIIKAGVWFRFPMIDEYEEFEKMLELIPFERVFADGNIAYTMPKVKQHYLILHPSLTSDSPLLLKRDLMEKLPKCREWIYLTKKEDIVEFDPRLNWHLTIPVALPSRGGPSPNVQTDQCKTQVAASQNFMSRLWKLTKAI